MTDSTHKARRVTPFGWATLTLAGTAMGLAVTAEAGTPKHAPQAMPETLWLAAAEGGEGGESGAAAQMGGDETVAFLTGLALIEGHLRAGVALYQAGLADQAASHMKHPQDEIYSNLAEGFEETGAEGFTDELTALATAVEGGADAAAVETAYQAVLAKIAAAEAKAGADDGDKAKAILGLMRTAAEEYALGVKDGTVTELHEYQDAWGFAEAAKARATVMAGDDEAEEKAFGEKALAAITDAAAAIPAVSPEGQTLGDPTLLPAAAATIELAAYRLK